MFQLQKQMSQFHRSVIHDKERNRTQHDKNNRMDGKHKGIRKESQTSTIKLRSNSNFK